MTSREETNALSHLQELLARDLSKVPLEELAAAVQESELIFAEAQKWSGRLVAAMKRREIDGREVSWSQIVKLTEVSQTTLHRRAQPYL